MRKPDPPDSVQKTATAAPVSNLRPVARFESRLPERFQVAATSLSALVGLGPRRICWALSGARATFGRGVGGAGAGQAGRDGLRVTGNELFFDEAFAAVDVDAKPVAGVVEDGERGLGRKDAERGELRAGSRAEVD